MTIADTWNEHADEWIKWARIPEHDNFFWDGTWPVLRGVLPRATGIVVDLGCGEGRSTRELAKLGYRPIGVEQSAVLAAAAHSGGSPSAIIRADASSLPLGSATVEIVVACMSLMDLDDLDGATSEIGRILQPGGSLCCAIVHPFATAQDEETLHSDHPECSHRYLEARRYKDVQARDGLTMTFLSMHRPLSEYVSAFARAGLHYDNE